MFCFYILLKPIKGTLEEDKIPTIIKANNYLELELKVKAIFAGTPLGYEIIVLSIIEEKINKND